MAKKGEIDLQWTTEVTLADTEKCTSHHICKCQAEKMEALKLDNLLTKAKKAAKQDLNSIKKDYSYWAGEVKLLREAMDKVDQLLSRFVVHSD